MASRSTERSHLSIGEVLSLLQDEFPDITISKIRFLESQGLLDPERTPSGYRKFYEADVRRLRWILTQQRDKFLPLKVIKERLEDGVDAEIDAPDASSNGATAAVPPAAEAAGEPAATDDDAPAPEPGDAPAPPEEAVAADPGTAEAAPADEPATLPIWMADAARAKADRGRSPRSGVGDGPDPLERDATSVSLSRDEMLAASGLNAAQLASLEDFALVRTRIVGTERYYDGEDLVVAQKAAGFLAHGVEARHLRLYKTTADREAALLESLVLPLVKQRSPEAHQRARDTMVELATLGQALRAALLRSALSEHLP